MRWWLAVLETLRKIFPPTPRYSKRSWYEWSTPFDPQLSELQDWEHGIVRRLSVEMVQANGLILDYEGDGATTWRVQ